MSLDYASIGLRIKHARNKASITQEQLADSIGVSRKHVSLLETAGTGISLELLVKVSNALHVSIEELLTDNLTVPNSISDTDLHYIMLDCTEQEERIITKAAKALKSILFEYGI